MRRVPGTQWCRRSHPVPVTAAKGGVRRLKMLPSAATAAVLTRRLSFTWAQSSESAIISRPLRAIS